MVKYTISPRTERIFQFLLTLVPVPGWHVCYLKAAGEESSQPIRLHIEQYVLVETDLPFGLGNITTTVHELRKGLALNISSC